MQCKYIFFLPLEANKIEFIINGDNGHLNLKIND